MKEPSIIAGTDSELMPIKELGVVILCGGKSSRMGFPKHELWFGGKTFLQSVVASVSSVSCNVVAVFGHGESVPEFEFESEHVQVLFDERPDLGPLEGIRTGLAALAPHVPQAFVTSCDVPGLQPALVRTLASSLADHDAVVPTDGERIYGMTAVYRTSMFSKIDAIYASGASRRVSSLQAMARTRLMPIEELKHIDPRLDSFTNVNTPEQYFELLERNGLTCPTELAIRFSTE
jgi:molybdopterin-guanine dinucleotide biosynthesis protein A